VGAIRRFQGLAVADLSVDGKGPVRRRNFDRQSCLRGMRDRRRERRKEILDEFVVR
jgi:hypothetical protein